MEDFKGRALLKFVILMITTMRKRGDRKIWLQVNP